MQHFCDGGMLRYTGSKVLQAKTEASGMMLQERNDMKFDTFKIYNPCIATWTAAVDVDYKECEELLIEIQFCNTYGDFERCCKTNARPQLSLCDHLKMQEMKELLKYAMRLEESAKKLQNHQQGTREWEDAVKSFWCIDTINAESLKSSCKKYAKMYHPDKLAGLSGASKVTPALAEKLIAIYERTIEPQLRKNLEFINREQYEVPCARPHGIKHHILHKGGEVVLRILCTAIKSDVDVDGAGRTLVRANIPGLNTDGSDSTNATFAFLHETVKETLYRVYVAEAKDATDSIEVAVAQCYTNVTCKHVYSKCAHITVVKDLFEKSARVTMLTSSGLAVNDTSLLISYLNCVLDVCVEDRHNCGFGVNINMTEYPWVFAPHGAFGCNGVTIKLQRVPLHSKILQSDEVEIQFLANLNSAPHGKEIVQDEKVDSEPSRMEEPECEDRSLQTCSPRKEWTQDSMQKWPEPIDVEPAKKRFRVWCPRHCYKCGRHVNEHEGHTYCHLDKVDYVGMRECRREHRRFCAAAGEQQRRQARAEYEWLRKQVGVMNHTLLNASSGLAWQNWYPQITDISTG